MTQMWPSKPHLMFDCIFYRNYLVIGIRRSFLKGELYRNVKSVLIHDLGGQKLCKLSRVCLGDFCPPISWLKNRKTLLEMSKKNCITCNFFFDLRIVNCYTNVHLPYHHAVGHCWLIGL